MLDYTRTSITFSSLVLLSVSRPLLSNNLKHFKLYQNYSFNTSWAVSSFSEMAHGVIYGRVLPNFWMGITMKCSLIRPNIRYSWGFQAISAFNHCLRFLILRRSKYYGVYKTSERNSHHKKRNWDESWQNTLNEKGARESLFEYDWFGIMTSWKIINPL